VGHMGGEKIEAL